MWASTGSWTSGSATVALADDGTITITGTTMADYSLESLPEWSAFSSEIKKVVANISVVHIGKFAFYSCANLETVELTNNLSSIGDAAFMYCGNLKSITLPENENFKYIKASTFFGSGLTGISIPASVTNIYNSAFGSCTALQYIRCKGTTPPTANASSFNSVPRSIPLYVPFQSLAAYEAAAVLSEFNVLPDPEQCPTWGNCGLQGDNLTWSLDCEGKLIISGSGAMANYEEGQAPWASHAGKIKTIIMSEGMTSIGNYAFAGCQNAALTSIVIPNGVLTIGKNAFYNCRNVKSFTIASTVQIIGESAFASCAALETLTLPSSLTQLGKGAFSYGKFSSILCAALVPPTCGTNVDPFYSVSRSIEVFVPASSVEAYKAANVWSEFGDNIKATGKKRITWLDEDGTEIKVDMVEEGQTPAFEGKNPEKVADEDYVYEFAGWLPKIKPVESDYHYVAHFDRTPKKFFNATVGGENCSLEVTTILPEGAYMNVTVNPDDCFQFEQWSDGNKDNPREITGDMNVSAELNKIKFKVTDESQNGHLNIAPQE